MRTNHRPSLGSNNASILLLVMGTIVVLGIALASVIGLTMQEHRVLSRTGAWNSALPISEAGIEEALSHLRQVKGKGSRVVNGWSADGTTVVRTRSLEQGQYTVGISASNWPVILSVGQVWCPSARAYVTRRIEVKTISAGKFFRGIVTQDSFKLSGNFTADSFDSSDPLYSTNGQYIASRHKDNGDLGSNLNTAGAMDFSGSNVKIYGSIATGPLGSVSGSGVTIGTTSFIDGGGKGIQTNHYAKDMNVSFETVTAPFTNGATPLAGIVNGINYKYVLLDGIDYNLSTLVLSSSDEVLVLGKARLLVNKDVKISGQGSVRIATNASLALYVKSGDVSLGGNGVANLSGKASTFQLFGLPAVTDIGLGGNGSFIGTIEAPTAKLTLSGGGSDVLDFVGAAIVRQIVASGSYNFHYDEALRNNSGNLVIASWREL